MQEIKNTEIEIGASLSLVVSESGEKRAVVNVHHCNSADAVDYFLQRVPVDVQVKWPYRHKTCILRGCKSKLGSTLYMTRFGPMCSTKCCREFPLGDVPSTLNPIRYGTSATNIFASDDTIHSHIMKGINESKQSQFYEYGEEADPDEHWLCKLLREAAGFPFTVAMIVDEFRGPPFTHSTAEIVEAIRTWNKYTSKSVSERQKCIDVLTAPALMMIGVNRLVMMLSEAHASDSVSGIIERKDKTPLTVADLWFGFHAIPDTNFEVDFEMMDNEPVCRMYGWCGFYRDEETGREHWTGLM